MSHRYRSLNRIAVALALAAVLFGARAGVEMFAAPAVTFSTLPNLNFNQGQAVTVAFAAQGFPTGVTYTAQGLPAGLSMSMGVDTLGHPVGILSGTLAPDTPTQTGSEGVYNARILASDGAVSNFFSIDVSHWNKGDVFVGAGAWNYQVYREDATFKTDLTVPDDVDITAGSTTGCAVNWRTGEVWLTNFDEILPAVNVITRHQGSNPLPFTDPSRRLSTERYGPGNGLTPFPGNLNPFDTNPESVAFDNAGAMFVGHSFGYWNDDFDVADANGNPTVLHNPLGAGWVYVDAAGLPILDILGGPIFSDNPISPAGFFERWVLNGLPTNVLSVLGLPIAVPRQGGMDLHKYAPDVNGNYAQANRQFFDMHYGRTGIDTLDLLSDQKTMVYTSEDWYMYRYDLATSAQMPVVGSTVLGESKPINFTSLYGLRSLPPGDGTGGYLVVDQFVIRRIAQDGREVQAYDVRTDPDYEDDPDQGWSAGDVNGWFSIAIAPDGRSFWAATRQDVYHFDIASGEVIGPKIRATVGTLHTNLELAGLCVMDEYRAAQEVCGVSGLGNNIDDDNDGTIDEGCFRVEICSGLSPGDDDGDGLVDYNDPDCGASPAEQCVVDGPTDNSVAGICDRADYEGDTVVVPGIPLPCVGPDCANWTFSYSATGLPAGLVINPGTGEVTGMPIFSIVNPNSPLSAPVVSHVTVTSTWTRTGDAPSTFSKAFDWTIYNRNRVPVAVDDGVQVLQPGASFSFNVRANDSDIDGDPFTILSFTQPPSGHGTVTQVGQNLVYTAPASGFAGPTAFTYSLQDSYSPAGVSNDAFVRVRINAPPVANPNTYTTPLNTALSIPVQGVLGNDSDPDGDLIKVVVATATPASNGTVVLNATGNGAFVYTPNTGFSGVDTFTYQVNDGSLNSNFTTVTITVLNAVPTAVNDAFTTNEDTALNATVTGNDTPSTDGGNVWSKVTNPVNGTATVNANGTFNYTPNANYNGTDAFTYKVCDTNNDCSTATVTITITSVDEAPLAANDTYSTPMDTPVTAAVQTNDTPSNDGGNVWTKLTDPTSGTVLFNADGTFTYTPVTGFSGVVSFNYRVCDVDGDCATATATITIVSPNRPPVAVNDVTTTPVNTPVNIPVISNDSDPDGDTISVISNTPPSTGTVTRSGNVFTFTPATGFTGTATFTYTISDGKGGTATATVTITITAPTCTPTTILMTGNTSGSGTAGNLRTFASGTLQVRASAFARSKSGGSWSTSYLGAYSSGLGVTDSSEGSGSDDRHKLDNLGYRDNYILFEFSSPVVLKRAYLDAVGADSDVSVWFGNRTDAFNNHATLSDSVLNAIGTRRDDASDSTSSASRWTAFNDAGLSGNVLVIAALIGDDTPEDAFKVSKIETGCGVANRAPVAVNDTYTTSKNVRLNTAAPGVKVNDSDPDGDAITVELTSNPTHGTLTQNADGSFAYTPSSNYVGNDSYTYKVRDSKGAYSNVATVTITITAIACNLVAVDDAYTTNENHALSIVAGGLFRNDQDPYGRGLSVSQVNGSSSKVGTTTATPHGTVKVNADGSFVYTPAANYDGTDTFTYQMKSAYNNSTDTATVTISIIAHYDGDGCDHDRVRNGHRDGDRCDHDKGQSRHYRGDYCDHDRNRNGHHSNDGCQHDRDTHRHYDGDGCNHDRNRYGHDDGDDCDHDKQVNVHRDGDYCDHDRNRSGHRDGDGCTHDKQTTHHNDGDGCDHDRKRSGHYDGDKCDHDGDDHSHNDGDGCDHDRGRNGHSGGDRCEHDRHSRDDDNTSNACVVNTEDGHSSDGHDDQHHTGDYCDHDRRRRGHSDNDGCEHDRVTRHSSGDACDHDRGRNGHRDNDGCDHDRSRRNDNDRNWGWNGRGGND